MTTDIIRHTSRWRGKGFSWFESGQGYPLVFLHGGGGTGKAFWHQIQYFSPSFRVIAPDMPGFGQSEWIDDVTSVELIPHVLKGWFEILNISQCILGGNSMGGRVALSFAAHYPHMVSALIILDSVGVTLPDVPIINPLTLPPDQFMSGLVHDPQRYRQFTPYRTLEDAKELNRGRQIFAKYLGSQGIVPDPDQNLNQITMPTLLIWGREDRIIPLAYGKALEKALPDAELVVFDDVGHLPHIEVPQLTNQSIAHFLERRLPGVF